jgi:hypothetical protein
MSAEDQCGACMKWISGEDRFFDNSYGSPLCKEHYYNWLDLLKNLRNDFYKNIDNIEDF